MSCYAVTQRIVRRKFVDALPGDKDLLPTSAAAKGVEYCYQLFLLERNTAAGMKKMNRLQSLCHARSDITRVRHSPNLCVRLLRMA